MHYLIALWISICLVCLNADPTIYGPTGLIEMPTAHSIGYKQVNVAVDYAIDNSNKDSNKDSDNHFYYKFNLGSFQHWELGILGGSFLDEGVFVNMKYFLMSNQEENPLLIAAGFERIGSKSDLATYLTASKRLEGGLNLHFGFKAFFQKGLNASAMFGGEYFSSEKLSLLADITGDKNDSYVLNGGMRVYLENNVSMRIYLIDITKSREKKETLYTFGLSLSKYL